MYPVMIVTLMAALFMVLINPEDSRGVLAPPSAITKPYEASSYGRGQNLALYIAGVQRLIAQYEIEMTGVAQLDLTAALQGGTPGELLMDWPAIATFYAGSPYATANGLTRTRLYQAGYLPSGPWNVLVLEAKDAAGVGTGEVGAIIGYADMGDASLLGFDTESMLRGLAQTFGNSANVGFNRAGVLGSRGIASAEMLSAGAQIRNIPAAIPDGALMYVRCYGQLDASVANDMCDG